jgi:hypothetical protein
LGAVGCFRNPLRVCSTDRRTCIDGRENELTIVDDELVEVLLLLLLYCEAYYSSSLPLFNRT